MEVAKGKVAAMQAALLVTSSESKDRKRASTRPSRFSMMGEGSNGKGEEDGDDLPSEDEVFAKIMLTLARTMDLIRVKLEFKKDLAPFFKAAGAMRDSMLATTQLIDAILFAAIEEGEASVDGSDSGSDEEDNREESGGNSSPRGGNEDGDGGESSAPRRVVFGGEELTDAEIEAMEDAYELILSSGQKLILSSRDTFRDDPPVPTAWQTRRETLRMLSNALQIIIRTPDRREEIAKTAASLVSASDATRSNLQSS